MGHRPVHSFSAVELLQRIGKPALVIHARHDREVPFPTAEAIAAACPAARLMPFDGIGHRTILYAPPVFRAVMNELAPERQRSTSTAFTGRCERSSAGREMNASA